MEGLRAKHGQILHPSRHSGTTSPESTMPRFVDNPNSWPTALEHSNKFFAGALTITALRMMMMMMMMMMSRVLTIAVSKQRAKLGLSAKEFLTLLLGLSPLGKRDFAKAECNRTIIPGLTGNPIAGLRSTNLR